MGRYKHHIFKSQDEEYILETISGWLPIRYKMITNQHRLFDLAEEEEEQESKSGKKKTRLLCYFVWGHCEYSINQVMKLTYPTFFENENGKTSFISGVVGISNTMGFAVEISDGGDAVRLFRERRVDKDGRNIA